MRLPDDVQTTMRLQIRVPTAWLPELDAAARANGQTRSALIRLVLRAFLRGRLEEPVG